MQIYPRVSGSNLHKWTQPCLNRRASLRSRWYPRTVLWSYENVHSWWWPTCYQLFVPWGLRWPRNLGHPSLPFTFCNQIKLPQEFYSASWKPRVSINDWKFHLQRRGPRLLWLRDLRSIYGSVWQTTYSSTSRKKISCRTWRDFSWLKLSRGNKSNWPVLGGA